MLYERSLIIESIRNYLITVISASAICTVVTELTDKKGSISSVIKILSGLFLAISVISPVLKISFDPISDYLETVQQDAQFVSDAGISQANAEKEVIIKNCLEAYIVDKATSLGLSVNANIGLDNDMIPVSVEISGRTSPYARRKLESYIADTLGIPKEAQTWR